VTVSEPEYSHGPLSLDPDQDTILYSDYTGPAEPCIPFPVHCLIVGSVATTGPAEPVHSVPCPVPDCGQWPLLVLQNRAYRAISIA
jgi:hypothetical protein